MGIINKGILGPVSGRHAAFLVSIFGHNGHKECTKNTTLSFFAKRIMVNSENNTLYHKLECNR
jgi:hypothetical protein